MHSFITEAVKKKKKMANIKQEVAEGVLDKSQSLILFNYFMCLTGFISKYSKYTK